MTPSFPLSLLLGGLFFLVLYRFFGPPWVIAVGALLFGWELYGEWRLYRSER
jgi:hypothetical protein